MVCCRVCKKYLGDQIYFQVIQNGQLLIQTQKIEYILRESEGIYSVYCSSNCGQEKFQRVISSQMDIFFPGTQHSFQFVQELQTLSKYIKQQIELTDYLFQQKSEKNIYIDQLRDQFTLSISNTVGDIIDKMIKNLEGGIQFAKSQTEKINNIKHQISQMITDQGIVFLDQKPLYSLFDIDVSIYKVNEMMQLMENLLQFKNRLVLLLSQK